MGPVEEGGGGRGGEEVGDHEVAVCLELVLLGGGQDGCGHGEVGEGGERVEEGRWASEGELDAG